MADDTNAAAGNAGGDTGAATTANTGAAAGIEEKTLLGADDSAGNTGADDTGANETDWRDRIAELGGFKDDAREMAWLKRFASEANYHKAIPKLRRDFSAGKTQPALPDDASPEEIAAHRKALGIPDKPDGYGLAFPDGVQVTEAHTALLSKVQEQALARNVRPADAKAMFDIYTQLEAETQTAQADAIAEAKLQNIAELRGEWKGSEYKRNIGILRDFFAKGFEGHEEALDLLSNATLPGGLRVGDSAKILKAMASFARSHADEEALIGGDGAGGGKSIDGEIEELMTKSLDGKLTGTENDRYNQLLEARMARDLRQQGRRAA